MKKILIMMISAMLVISSFASVAYAEAKNAEFDFESGLPSTIQKRGGYAAASPVDERNALYMKDGAEYFISDGNSWPDEDAIYYKADVKATSGASFVCFGTRRTSNYNPFVTFDNGNIVAGTEIVSSYVPGNWYTIQAVVEGTSLRLYVDGIKVCENVSVLRTHTDASSFLAFRTKGGAGYIDDIVVSNVIPEIAEIVLFGIESVNPPSGEKDVDISGIEFEIVFDVALDDSSFENCISINEDAVAKVKGYDADNRTMTVEVSSLKSGTEYMLTFTDALKGANGEVFDKFDENAIITFSTGYEKSVKTFDTEKTVDPLDPDNRVRAAVSKTTGGDKLDRLSFDGGSSGAIGGNNFYISADVFIPEDAVFTSFNMYPMASNAKGNGNARVIVNPDFTVCVGDGSGNKVTDSKGRDIKFEKGVWHKVEYKILSQKVDMYIDGYKISGNGGSNLTDVTFLIINLVSDDGCEFYFDNFVVTNDPEVLPDTSFAALSGEVSAGGYPTVTFNKRIDSSADLKSFVTVKDSEGNSTDNFGVSLSKDKQKLVLSIDELVPNADYTANLSGLSSEYGVEMSGKFEFSFKTPEAVMVGETVYSSADGVITELCTGEIFAETETYNGTSNDCDVTYIMALCEGDEECYSFVSLATVSKNDIKPGEKSVLKASLNIDNIENRFVKVFVWKNVDKPEPYNVSKAFK